MALPQINGVQWATMSGNILPQGRKVLTYTHPTAEGVGSERLPVTQNISTLVTAYFAASESDAIARQAAAYALAGEIVGVITPGGTTYAATRIIEVSCTYRAVRQSGTKWLVTAQWTIVPPLV